MNCFRESGYLGMAAAALHFGSLLGMREFADRGMAIAAAQDSVDAGRVSLRADGDVFPCFGFQPGLAVAGEARRVLLCNTLLRGCGRRNENREREEERHPDQPERAM